MTSQDTSPLLNKVTRAPSDILIGQTCSANSSHGLPKYLMIHSPFCSIHVTYTGAIVLLLYIHGKLTIGSSQFLAVCQGVKQISLYSWYPLVQSEWDRCDQQNLQT